MRVIINRRAKVLTIPQPAIEIESAPAVEHVQAAPPVPRLGVGAVWRDALSTFSARSAAILFCAIIGVAMPIIVGNWLYVSAKLSEYARTRSVFALYEKPGLAIVLAEMIVGLLVLTFARGVITWIALHRAQPCGHGEACGSLGAAIRRTFVRYPALLASMLFYGATISAGIVGMSALTQPLEYNRSKNAHVWIGVARNFSDVLRQLMWRGFNTLVPDPGPPFAQLAPDLRRAAQRGLFKAYSHNDYLSAEYGSSYGVERYDPRPELYAVSPTQAHSAEFRPLALALGSIALVLLAETLLRFRTVMAMKPFRSRRPEGFGLLTPLIASTRFGIKHFGVITAHIWIVRLAIFALIVAFIEFPLAMMDNLLAPFAKPTSNLEILPIMGFLETSGAALVSAILFAFSVVYDARLAMRLEMSRSTNLSTN